MRIVIIGNSGSGKTTLAARLTKPTGLPTVNLDAIFWEPGGFAAKRPANEIDVKITSIRLIDGWIVEGVFGDLASRFLDRATHLVFVDLPWDECRSGLLQRGSESSRQRDAAEAASRFAELIDWAEDYYIRQGPSSRQGHAELFESFVGRKLRLTDRPDVTSVLAALTAPEKPAPQKTA